MTSAVIYIADGTEEMEFTITYDTLVRAGVSCTSVFVPNGESSGDVNPLVATCSRGVKIIPDADMSSLEDLAANVDLIVVPGGAKGAETISQNEQVKRSIQDQISKGKLVGMICAGSLAALTSGLRRQAITSHPSVRSQLENNFIYREDFVVVSDKLVTSRGPGTAFPFALKLVELLLGKEKRDEIEAPMIFAPGAI